MKRFFLGLCLICLTLTTTSCGTTGSAAAVMVEIRKMAVIDAIYGKTTDVDVQINAPIGNASVKVKTGFRVAPKEE